MARLKHSQSPECKHVITVNVSQRKRSKKDRLKDRNELA